ncbi:MAG: hypothetical protein ACLQD9_08095 [Thermoplasmata archaeon]
MDSRPAADPRRPSGSEDMEAIHDIIPARAVLTELARGFLLVRDKDPKRAARFAATFLRERVGAEPPPAARKAVVILPAYAALAHPNRGPIDRGGFSGGR